MHAVRTRIAALLPAFLSVFCLCAGAVHAQTTPATFDPPATVSKLAAEAQKCFQIDVRLQIEKRQCIAQLRQAVLQIDAHNAMDLELAVERGPDHYGDIIVSLVFMDADSSKVKALRFSFADRPQYIDLLPHFDAPVKQ